VHNPAGQRTPKNGFSLIELLIVVAILLIIAAIAIPSLMRARMSSNEASAVGSLRTMNTALVNYTATYQLGYPAALSNLGPAASPSSTSADLLDSVLAAGVKSGYAFSYTPGTPVNGIISSYSITADPVNRGVSGQRSFFTDQALVIHANSTTTASASDPPLK
jgi:prepilin-type N-terminal cleavage/methylation domain-containing protein